MLITSASRAGQALIVLFFLAALPTLSAYAQQNVPLDQRSFGPPPLNSGLDGEVDGAEAEVRQRLVRLRVAEWEDDDDELVDQRRREVGEAERQFRFIYGRALLEKLGGLSKEQRFAEAQTTYSTAKARRDRDDRAAPFRWHRYSAKVVDERDAVAIQARIETALRLNRLAESAALASLSSLSPFIDIRGRQYQAARVEERYFIEGGLTNRTSVELIRLANQILKLAPREQLRTQAQQDEDIPIEVVRKIAALRQELDLREYHRLALSGLIVDPVTNEEATGLTRLRLAVNAERALSEFLQNFGRRERLTTFFYGEPIKDLGLQIDKDWQNRPEFQLVKYLEEGREPIPQEFFRAAERVIRHEQQAVLNTFNEQYLGGSADKVGLDQLLRVSNVTGETSLASVQLRMQEFELESEAAAEAFQLAATNTVSGLKSANNRAYTLLKEMGYIIEEDDEEKYILPESHAGFSSFAQRARGGVDIPGRSWLAVVNARNVAVALASIAVPEMAGTLVTGSLAGMRASHGGVLAVRMLTEMYVDSLISAGDQMLDNAMSDKPKPLEWDRLILESYVLGSVLQFTKGSSDAVFDSVITAGRTSNRMATGAVDADGLADAAMLFKLSDNQTKFLSVAKEALGLVEETSLTTFYNTYVQGEMDEDGWKGVLLQAIITRKLGEAHADAPNIVGEALNYGQALKNQAGRGLDAMPVALASRLPEAVHTILKADPRLAGTVIANGAKAVQEADAALARFDALYDNIETLRGIDVMVDLLRGNLSWADTQTVLRERGDGFEAVMDEVAGLRKLWTDTMVKEAVRRSIDDINKIYSWELQRAGEEATGEADLTQRTEDIEGRRKLEIALAREAADAPGSQGRTSDIDRSARSKWVRRHLQALYRVQAEGLTGPMAPTSARALDVNEYIDVRPFIGDRSKYAAAMRNVVPGADDGGPKRGNLNHDQIMGGLSLASAMKYMAPAKRDLFLKNKRDDLNKRPAEDGNKTSLEDQIALALDSLATSGRELADLEAEIAARDPERSEHEVHILALDKLYDTRMDKIRELEWELERMESPTGPKADALRSEIERRMTVALRDGIETYSSLAGIDIILNRVQSSKIKTPDGERNMNATDRLKDPNFTVNGELSSLSDTDVDGFINDQVMFIAKHIEGFNSGGENHYQAGRAFGKYLTRIFLGFKVQGRDIEAIRRRPPYDAERRLLEFAETLLANKNRPKELVETLKLKSSTHPKSADGGMAELFFLIEKVVPGMKDMTGVIDRPDGPYMSAAERKATADQRRPRRLRNIRQVWQWEQDTAHGLGGAEIVLTSIDKRKAELRRELTLAQDQIAEARELGADYEDKDWKEVVRLNNLLREKKLQYAAIPWRNSPTGKTLKQAVADLDAQLKAIPERNLQGEALDDALYESSAAFRRLMESVNRIEEELPFLDAQIEKNQRLAEEERLVAGLDLSGSWICADGTGPEWPVAAEQENTKLTMVFRELGSEEPALSVELDRRWRRFYGYWQGAEDDQGVAAMEPALDGETLHFTTWSTTYPDSPWVLPRISCRRGEIVEAPVPDVDSLIVVQRSDNALDFRPDGYDGPPTSRVQIAYLSADESRNISAGGIDGVSINLFSGRRMLDLHEVDPGTYTLVVDANGSRYKEDMVVGAGELIELEARLATLKLDPTLDAPPEQINYSIFAADDLTQPLTISRGGNVPLVPGKYSVRFDNVFVEPTWQHDIDLTFGETKIIESGWAQIDFSVNESQATQVVLRPKGAAPEAMGRGVGNYPLLMPPGDYVIEWTEKKKRKTKAVTVVPNGRESIAVP